MGIRVDNAGPDLNRGSNLNKRPLGSDRVLLELRRILEEKPLEQSVEAEG